MAKRAITDQLADALKEIVSYRMERDPVTQSIIVSGSVLAALDKED
jgi:hypothetical protein